jgi:putative endonuclease
MAFYIYVLQSEKNNQYYIGATSDIGKRLIRHNKGYSRYTKAARPWKLVYKEVYDTLSEARKREKQIKAWKKRAAIEQLIRGGAKY